MTFFTSLGNMEFSFSKLTAHIHRKQNLDMSVNVMGIDLQQQNRNLLTGDTVTVEFKQPAILLQTKDWHCNTGLENQDPNKYGLHKHVQGVDEELLCCWKYSTPGCLFNASSREQQGCVFLLP